MRLVVIIVAALTIVGVAALGLILAQKGGIPKGNIPTATMTSTVYIPSATQEVPAPTRAPSSQIAQATVSKRRPSFCRPTSTRNPTTQRRQSRWLRRRQRHLRNLKDQTPSTISKAMVHETTRLKDDATGWAHKLQELELDLKLQLDLKNNQDVEATGKNINECLVVLRAAAGRSPGAETRAKLRKQEVAVRDLAIRAEVHPGPGDSQDRRLFSTKDHRTARSRSLR